MRWRAMPLIFQVISTFSPVGSDILNRYENVVHTIWKQYADSGKREISRFYLHSNIIYL